VRDALVATVALLGACAVCRSPDPPFEVVVTDAQLAALTHETGTPTTSECRQLCGDAVSFDARLADGGPGVQRVVTDARWFDCSLEGHTVWCAPLVMCSEPG
jgi:hypothetical protein